MIRLSHLRFPGFRFVSRGYPIASSMDDHATWNLWHASNRKLGRWLFCLFLFTIFLWIFLDISIYFYIFIYIFLYISIYIIYIHISRSFQAFLDLGPPSQFSWSTKSWPPNKNMILKAYLPPTTTKGLWAVVEGSPLEAVGRIPMKFLGTPTSAYFQYKLLGAIQC